MTIIPISKSSPSFVFYGKFNSLILWSGSAGAGGGGLVEGGGGASATFCWYVIYYSDCAVILFVCFLLF